MALYRRAYPPLMRQMPSDATLTQLFDLISRWRSSPVGHLDWDSRLRALVDFGALVVPVARKRDELDEAVAILAGIGVPETGLTCDLAPPGIAALLAKDVIRRLGRIDILAKNAGTSWRAPAEEQ